MGLMDILNQYTGGNAGTLTSGSVSDHFKQVAAQLSPQELGPSVAAAFRSDATPAFGDMVGGLFRQSSPQQQASVLNQLIPALGGGALSGVAGGVLGRILGGSGASQAPTITAEQASQLSPADVSAIAAHAEKQDPSIIDKVGSFYAQHPALVQTLGAVALSAVMGHLNSNRQRT